MGSNGSAVSDLVDPVVASGGTASKRHFLNFLTAKDKLGVDRCAIIDSPLPSKN